MAIRTQRIRDYVMQKEASESLAEQLAKQQKDEGGFQSFLSIAAPIAASILLPGLGTMAMGTLGSLAGGGGLLGGLLGGVGTAGAGGTGLLGALAGSGSGIMSTLGGAALKAGAKGLGTYALSEGLEDIGRSQGYGADISEITLDKKYGRKGRSALKEAKEGLQSQIDLLDEGQKKTAITSALMSLGTEGATSLGNQLKESIEGMDMFKGTHLNPGTADISKSSIGQELIGEYGTAPEAMIDTGDILKSSLPSPEFKTPLATEGGSPLNFLTGEVVGEKGQTWAGAQANLLEGMQKNLLDSPPSFQGTSILDSLTQFTKEESDYLNNIISYNPDITQQEIDEIIASFRGQ